MLLLAILAPDLLTRRASILECLLGLVSRLSPIPHPISDVYAKDTIALHTPFCSFCEQMISHMECREHAHMEEGAPEPREDSKNMIGGEYSSGGHQDASKSH